MDDDELQMLQREFMSVQQQKTNPLAERTVAQIMVKLYHQGFKFYSTTDGNEYLTPQKLDKQIMSLILERGHLNIGILPQILNVGLDTVQSRIIKLLTKHSSESTNVQSTSLTHTRIFRHNTLLLSQKHLISILQNIKQLLLTEGRVNLQTIAQQNQFNIKFTQKLIKENIGSLNAQLTNNQLITKEYNFMKKVKLLGFLRAISNPISFQNLAKCSKLSDKDDNRTLQRLLVQIIQEKRVLGKYQNSYYVPESFILNQKQRIFEFFSSNGFIQFQMLQKQFLVSNSQEWLRKNLTLSKQFTGKFQIFEDVCILTSKLQHFAHNIDQSLNHQGFIQISNVLPFTLQEKELEKFLNQYCQLKQYFLYEGHCYSEKWLQKVLQQFKQKVFKRIFSSNQNKNDPKNAKKKGGKKDSKNSKLIQQQELVQKLYNQGLAQYSVAENIAPALIQILNKKLEDLKKKYEKQLAQNRGILNSSFLKYRSCNTIMRNLDGLQRILNIIEKQKKKNNQNWIDKDFGPNQNDEKGVFSIIYYDNILPKQWPKLQDTLKWQATCLKSDKQLELGLISSNSLFGEILNSVQTFNRNFAKQNQIDSPFSHSKLIQSNFLFYEEYNLENPFSFSFYRTQSDKRYVIVDDKLPMIDQKFLGYSGLYGLVEKAYAKFRYCYKGIMNISVKNLILQLTGHNPTHHTIQKNNHNDVIEIIKQAIEQNKMIICLAEGESGKKIQIGHEEQIRLEIEAMRSYLCVNCHKQNNKNFFYILRVDDRSQIKNNQGQKIEDLEFCKVFKNIYIL